MSHTNPAYEKALSNIGLNASHDIGAPLFIPDSTEPIGYLSIARDVELSGVRAMIKGELYEAVVTGYNQPLYFAKAQE